MEDLLLLFTLSCPLLLLEALGDLLPQGWQLDYLLALQLAQQASNLSLAHVLPFFVLPLLNLQDLALGLMSPDVILLFGHLFFDFPQTDDLTRLSFFSWNGLLHNNSELQSFLAVSVQCLSLQFLSLRLILHKLIVPVLVELIHFFMMGCLNFPLLLLKSSHQFVPSLFFQFYLQFC